MSPLLSLSDVVVRREGFRLEVDGLVLAEGEVLGVVGPNGAGKSTLLHASVGLLPLHGGSITLQGRELSSLSRTSIARLVGYLPQDVPLLFPYTVAETVLMGRYPHLRPWDRPGRKDHEAVRRALELTDAESLRDRRIDRLSGGELKRVLLASVLAQEPRGLFLDEPLAGLDLDHATSFAWTLRDLAAEGVGVLLVTHDLNIASLVCDRLVLLARGKIVAAGDPSHVLKDEVLGLVYRGGASIVPHPETGVPMVLPRAIAQSGSSP